MDRESEIAKRGKQKGWGPKETELARERRRKRKIEREKTKGKNEMRKGETESRINKKKMRERQETKLEEGVQKRGTG